MISSTQFFDLGPVALGNDKANGVSAHSGVRLPQVTLAYETYGRLNSAKDNAILVFHALSGSQHLAGVNSELSKINKLWTSECHIGWWDNFVGTGKAIDTDHFFVICANYIGGCYGSTGPSSINPTTGLPFGSSFPHISINEIVDTQVMLLDSMGIDRLHAVIGPSLGGMLALNLTLRYPERVDLVVPISCALEVSTLQKLSRFEQIRAIEMDVNFRGGDYYDGEPPNEGLSLARMIAHKSYVSLDSIAQRAKRSVLASGATFRRYRLNHAVESYMLHQGEKFVKRFDANTYLVIAEAWQKFNLVSDVGGTNIAEVLSRARNKRFLVFSIDSDVCFYPEEQQDMVRALKEVGIHCNHTTVHSDKGHDAFLLEPDLFAPCLRFELFKR